jgi:hypothetical protein
MSVHIPPKHRIRLWAALRWLVLLIAIIFVVGYVGIIMHVPPINNLQTIYPDLVPKLGFYIHVVPGSIWFIFGALQFFGYIRAKNPQAHRVIGTISLFMVIISVAGGMVVVTSGKSEGGKSMEVFGTFFFAGWIVCVSKVKAIAKFINYVDSNLDLVYLWLVLHALPTQC